MLAAFKGSRATPPVQDFALTSDFGMAAGTTPLAITFGYSSHRKISEEQRSLNVTRPLKQRKERRACAGPSSLCPVWTSKLDYALVSQLAFGKQQLQR